MRQHPEAGSREFETYRAERPALEPDLSSLFALFRQSQGVFRSIAGDDTLADLGRLLASIPEVEANHAASDVDSPPGSLDAELDALSALGSPTERWVFEERLDAGAMGVVDRVWDRNLKREAARKTVTFPIGRDPQARLALFLEEIRVISKLEHPAILPIYEAGLDEHRRLYFVMKLVRDRNTLLSVLEKLHGEPSPDPTDRWTLTRVLGHLVSVAQALAYSHSRGVLHRDVKPANIMVGRYGETYLLDWGLAQLFGDECDPEAHSQQTLLDEQAVQVSTSARRWVGTPSYMAPERVAGPELPEDPREDVYSLGAVLYNALCGTAPFLDQLERPELNALRELVEHGRPTPIAVLAPGAPEDLLRLCEAAMSREREARPASAEEFARSLQKYLADVSEDRVEARRQASRAQRTFDFLLNMLREADPYIAQGRETTVREVLERASAQASERLKDDPEDAALMLTTLAEMLLTMGHPERAQPLLDQAVAILTELGDAGREPRLKASYERARCAAKLGKPEESERIYRELLTETTEHHGADGELALKALYGIVGLLRRDLSRLAEAASLSKELLERRYRVNGPEHAESLAAAVQLAWLLKTQGSPEAGEQLLQRIVGLLLERHGDKHLHTLLGMSELANFLEAEGQLERASELHHRCATQYRLVVGKHGTGHCVSLANAAWVDHRLGRSVEAERNLLIALKHLASGRERDQLFVVVAQHNLGLVQLSLGKHQAACEQLGRVVRDAQQGAPDVQAALGRFRSNWGHALLVAGRVGDGRQQLTTALAELRAMPNSDPQWTVDAEAWLGQASASDKQNQVADQSAS